MTALTPEESLIEAVALVQGVAIDEADCDAILADFATSDQRYQRIWYEAINTDEETWLYTGSVDNGKILKIVASVALGFATGGVLGGVLALAGAIFGGGKKKDTRNSDEDNQKEEERFNQTYGLTNGGQLAVVGTPVPLCYGSRSKSIDGNGQPCGGTRIGGLLLNSRIETLRGTNFLYELWTLGYGEDELTGYGRIQHVSSPEIFFNKQSRLNFSEQEIKTQVRLGTQQQTPSQWFEEYSQNLSPDSYSDFGIDRRAIVNTWQLLQEPSYLNADGVFFGFNPAPGPTFIQKARATAAWDSYAKTATTINNDNGDPYIWMEFIGGAGQNTFRAAGLSGSESAITSDDLDYGFYFTPAGYQIVEAGRPITSITAHSRFEVFRIETNNTGTLLRYLVGNQEKYVSRDRPAPYLYGHFLFFNHLAFFENARTSKYPSGLRGTAEGKSSFTTSAEDFTSLTATDDYTIPRTTPARNTERPFKILQKNNEALTATINTTRGLPTGQPIYAYWAAKYETTKRVTALELNLAFNVHARATEGNAQVTFGVMFLVSIYPTFDRPGTYPNQKDTYQKIGLFYVRSRSPATQYRAIRIGNLPIGRYVVEIEPISVPTSGAGTIELTDSGNFYTYTAEGVIQANTLVSNPIVRVEGRPHNVDATIVSEMDYTNKTQVSSQSGATGKISSVNELVNPAIINIPAGGTPNPYRGLSTLAIRYEASASITGSPGISTPVWEGRSIPNLMAAGSSSGLSSGTQLVDPTSNFSADQVQLHWTLRNLTKGIESRITQVSGSTLTTESFLDWQIGDRYLVYFISSTPYFPDVLADVATNPIVGAGDKVNRDRDIDYPSFVAARKFCVSKRFYWNGIVQAPPTPIKQWAEREAQTSLLLTGYIDGRWALFPDELTSDLPQVFNTSNSRDAITNWVPWTNSSMNRLIIRFSDGRDLFSEDGARFRTKAVIIETEGLDSGLEPPTEQILDMPAITSPIQAIEVGVTAFNSARFQDRTIEFVTSMQAAYTQGGNIISYQHSLLDVGEAFNSFVAEAEPYSAGTQKVRLAEPPVLFEGLTSIVSENGAQFDDQLLTETRVAVGDLLINVTAGTAATITAISASQFRALLPFDQGDLARVLNLTVPASISASVTYSDTGANQTGVQFSFERRGLDVWIVFTGLNQALSELDPVNIGGLDSLYRVQNVQPAGRNLFKVSAVYHPGERLYSREGLIVQFDDFTVRGNEAIPGLIGNPPPSTAPGAINPPTTPTTVRIEAESMTLTGYSVQAGVGGAVVIEARETTTAKAQAVFFGASSTYDITVRYYDTNEAVAQYELRLDGITIAEWPGNGGATGSGLPPERDRLIVNTVVNQYSTIEIIGRQGSFNQGGSLIYDYAAVDYIELVPV